MPAIGELIITEPVRLTNEAWGLFYSVAPLTGSHRYHSGKDRGIVEERENLMSKDCLAYRIVSYINVGDGKARTDRKGEIGKVALPWTLLAGKIKPSGRLFGSVVKVGVVERIGGVEYCPRRDHS